MAAVPKAELAPQVVSSEVIQQFLDENEALIIAVLENQNLGKLNECARYQQRLQQNLMYLAALADASSAASNKGVAAGPAQQDGAGAASAAMPPPPRQPPQASR